MLTSKEFQKVLCRAKDIVWQEQNNRHAIYLYGIGSYWVAFEKSAYLLHCLTESYGLSVINVKEVPFPMIMTYITDSELASLSGNIKSIESRKDYKVFSTSFPTTNYNNWYRKVLEE